MPVSKPLMLAAIALCVANGWGQSNERRPHIGYLYPAGGQQGAVFQITAGGQYLRGVTNAYVSGEGVRARVIQYYPPVGNNIQKEQREELQERLREAWEKRWAESGGDGPAPALPGIRLGNPRPGQPSAATQKSATDRNSAAKKDDVTTGTGRATGVKPAGTAPFRPIEHPLLYDLENKSLRELRHLAYEIFFPRQKKQLNPQIAESALIEITMDPGAAPGDRELRLGTPLGLTNPMVFQVGTLPETRELEPNDPKAPDFLPREPPLDLPILLNGQIMPGDVDRFRFRAKKGQHLVIRAQARWLIPYLADAVPGWFQATLALYDAGGKEAAFDDDYGFDPDPVLFYRIPDDGEYELEIRDSIYRGREDFVYRVAVGEQPFITEMFPLGGRTGVTTVASIAGWNLSKAQLPLDTQPGGDCIRQTALRQGKWISNCVAYAVDTLPECDETEPNDSAGKAQAISLPRIVNGRIARPGDVDVFQFKGRAGEEVVAEVFARRLRSPLDSVLRLADASGRVLEWNDDCEQKDGQLRTEAGLLTHQADSYLRARLPKDGLFRVHLADAQHHGGQAYAYRLRIGAPRPDFALRVSPSSISMPAGRAAPVCVHALRKDGFKGEIEIVLKDAPAGFALNGGRIPDGRDSVRMTLTAPREPLDQPVVLRLKGRARIGGQTVSRPVIPSEDMMQAFLYRHLAPSRELMAAVIGRGRGAPLEMAGGGSIRIPVGGTAQVRIKTPRFSRLAEIELELSEPPEGVTLQEVKIVPDGLAFLLKADGDAAKVGFADNLIVEAFTESAGGGRNDNAANRKRRVSLGVLPAIPFEIVRE